MERREGGGIVGGDDGVGGDLGRGADLVVGPVAEGVEQLVVLVDASEVELGQLDGADVLASHGGGEVDGGRERIDVPHARTVDQPGSPG